MTKLATILAGQPFDGLRTQQQTNLDDLLATIEAENRDGEPLSDIVRTPSGADPDVIMAGGDVSVATEGDKIGLDSHDVLTICGKCEYRAECPDRGIERTLCPIVRKYRRNGGNGHESTNSD